MVGLPTNLSLASTENLAQTQKNDTGGGTGGSGLRSSVINNFAQGGSSLSSGISDAAGGVPSWLWAVMIALGAGGLWWAWKGRQ